MSLKVAAGDSITTITFMVPDGRSNADLNERNTIRVVTGAKVIKAGDKAYYLTPSVSSKETSSHKQADLGKIRQGMVYGVRKVSFPSSENQDKYVDMVKKYQKSAFEKKLEELKAQIGFLENKVENYDEMTVVREREDD